MYAWLCVLRTKLVAYASVGWHTSETGLIIHLSLFKYSLRQMAVRWLKEQQRQLLLQQQHQGPGGVGQRSSTGAVYL